MVQRDQADPPGDSPEGTNEQTALAATTEAEVAKVLLPEVEAAIRQAGGGQVDVNVLLVNVVNKVADPREIIEYADHILDVAQRFEAQRTESFKLRAAAIIDAKNRDPDEQEKRRNNRVRRGLKLTVAAVGLVSLVGALGGIWAGAHVVVIMLLLAMAAIALAMLGPLATGESVSSNDVVSIVAAMRTLFRRRDDEEAAPKKQQVKRRR